MSTRSCVEAHWGKRLLNPPAAGRKKNLKNQKTEIKKWFEKSLEHRHRLRHRAAAGEAPMTIREAQGQECVHEAAGGEKKKKAGRTVGRKKKDLLQDRNRCRKQRRGKNLCRGFKKGLRVSVHKKHGREEKEEPRLNRTAKVTATRGKRENQGSKQGKKKKRTFRKERPGGRPRHCPPPSGGRASEIEKFVKIDEKRTWGRVEEGKVHLPVPECGLRWGGQRER